MDKRGEGLCAPFATGISHRAGFVYNATAQGRRGVADRLVFYGTGLEETAAVTTIDDQGRFLLCGLPQSRALFISEAFGPSVTVPPGSDTDLETEAW
jgi:hypothetical protein